jgi:hypothetical protein
MGTEAEGSPDKPNAEASKLPSSTGISGKITAVTAGIVALTALLGALDNFIAKVPVTCKMWSRFPWCEEAPDGASKEQGGSPSIPGKGKSGVSKPDNQNTTEMESLQTGGLNALLDRHFNAGKQAYDRAYIAWPSFRNVDEIRKLLNKSSIPKTDQDWKALYRSILRFDLRGVDQNTIARLKKEAG